jgi:hypothetical protein
MARIKFQALVKAQASPTVFLQILITLLQEGYSIHLKTHLIKLKRSSLAHAQP